VNIAGIVSELKAERTRIDRAITAIEGISPKPNGSASTHAPKQAKAAVAQKSRGLTAAGRRRLSELMKKRWAERRKKAASKK
jgi:hypothetical protein